MTGTGPPSREDVFAVVASAVHDIVPDVAADEIRPTQHLRDLGADSVDRVEIIGAVLEELGVEEPLSSFSDLPDIDAMVDLLQQRLHDHSPHSPHRAGERSA